MVAHAIISVLKDSMHLKGVIVLTRGRQLTLQNCPYEFKEFYQNSIKLNQVFSKMDENQINVLRKEVLISNNSTYIETLADTIKLVATEIMKRPKFKEMIGRVQEFMSEMMDVNPKNQTNSLHGVTEALVQETFGHMAVITVVEEKEYISSSDLESMEGFIFFAIPAFSS